MRPSQTQFKTITKDTWIDIWCSTLARLLPSAMSAVRTRKTGSNVLVIRSKIAGTHAFIAPSNARKARLRARKSAATSGSANTSCSVWRAAALMKAL